MKNGSANFCI